LKKKTSIDEKTKDIHQANKKIYISLCEYIVQEENRKINLLFRTILVVADHKEEKNERKKK